MIDRRHLWVLAVLGCQPPAREPTRPPATPPTEAEIGQAALAAVVAAPWDVDPTGWGSLCTPEAPCDTIVIEPRIVALPVQAPAFFVPDRREQAATLSPYALSLSRVPNREIMLGAWRECSSRRDDPRWSKGRVACVAVGVAGFEKARPDAMTFALLVEELYAGSANVIGAWD